VNKYQHFECAVCGEKVPVHRDGPRTPTVKCAHDPTLCQDCLSEYITFAVKGGRWSNIKCPDEKCNESLGGRDVSHFVTADTAKK
jgi:hypothetical protein